MMNNDDRYSYDFANLISEYRFADTSLGFVGVECFIIALITGIIKESFGWGIAAFVIIIVLYAIPIIGGVISIVLSLAEMLIVYELLKMVAPEPVTLFLSLFALFVIIQMHRHFGNIQNDGIFGYSLIVTESLFSAFALWFGIKSIPLACVLFVILMIVIFIPKLRGIGFVGLAIATAVYTFGFTYQHLAIQYSVITSLIMLVYVSYNHYKAYALLDYRGIKKEKDAQKQWEENFMGYEMLKKKIYDEYPDLEKQYFYFNASVCKNESEREAFELDWKRYLNYLESSNFCTFNQFFEDNKLYRYSNYNKDFAHEWREEQERQKEHEKTAHKKEEQNEYSNEKIIYFTGVKDADSLKKRYRDLLKIYHPDNQNGDTSTVQQIQKEYELLKKQFE